ncbi:sulfatase-like hydrolase/transferase [Cyclobacterium jeungdonense]|uniref:Sulfatase-like hydrolase/transferase n=1 Tax=Cyclobacterium jeungdonense TaxID=708087 RepID=A0ABT8C902_9BACT|nr:sulfatase-like hydrolase/transferase [Cyclobacterium jeungdonense]MDN3688847.1 sulfatase-like hydrolase/transferase [Cyclobacterium jeungdonense]
MVKLTCISLLIVLSVFWQTKHVTSGPSRPNILIIMVDDLGKEWISQYGAADITTPAIDALAESGITFTNAYAMPQCTPTRVTLLTGQYPFRHGWVNHWDVPRWGGGAHFDETRYPSLGKELKKAGYATCIAGKWQIDDFRVEPDALTKSGFDDYCMWTGYESGVAASANRYQDPYVYTKEGSKTRAGEFGPDVFKRFIVDFIQENKDDPMFIYYPMVLTHTPFVNTPNSAAPDSLGKHKAMVTYTDRITGELVKALEDAGVRDNTVIIWTTDNGTTGAITGNRNGFSVPGGKAKTIESGINVPFLVSWPDKIKANRVSDALIDFTDIFPTCLELAGIPAKRQESMEENQFVIDGFSFKDVLLNGDEYSSRKWILAMGGGNNAARTENGVENEYLFRDRVVRNKQYKLYINSKREPEKFIDLLTDPMETTNLLDSLDTDERKRHFKQLREVIPTFPEKDSDPKYTPNPAQAWDVPVTEQSQVWKKQ